MRLLLIAVLVTGTAAGGLPDTSPVRTATAGAAFTRLQGNHVLGMNPAQLGYYGKPLLPGMKDKVTAAAKAGVTQDHYSVQLMASPNKRLAREAQRLFRYQFGQAIPSAIVVVDSLYKLRVGDYRDRGGAEGLRDTLVAAGYRDAWIVTEFHPLIDPGRIPYFSMTLAGVSLEAGNNAIYPTWVNQQLFGGLDLREPGKKEDFLAVFPAGVWNLNVRAGLTSLSFAVGNWGVSMVAPRMVSNVNLPTAAIDVLFRGVRFDEPRDLSTLKMDLLGAAPVGVAYGRQLELPPEAEIVDRLYAGVGMNLLVGLADVHIVADHLDVMTTPDSILVEGRTRVISNADPKAPAVPVMGTGLSIDLGLAADINERLRVSLAWKDLLGTIRWPKRTTRVNEFSLQLSSQEIEAISRDYQQHIDTLKQGFAKSDTSYGTGAGRTVYPSQVIAGAAWQVSPELVLDAALMHTLENDYLEAAAPMLSVGLGYAPTPVFPVYGGVGIGGTEGFRWGTGFALNVGAFQWSLGFGQSGGLFNGARGASLSTEFRLIY
ncbi:MAG: SPOR domain-containing protein [Fidelibacterota bacterium]|nr:MAG: SPOR domain-containing protein [Candidatus Neomarinimicrobiota bacterium]